MGAEATSKWPTGIYSTCVLEPKGAHERHRVRGITTKIGALPVSYDSNTRLMCSA